MKTYKIKVKVLFYKEEQFYVAHSPLLDIAVNSPSESEAKKQFITALQLVIESWVGKNIIEEKLEQLGLTPKRQTKNKLEDKAIVDIPFGELIRSNFKVRNIERKILA